MGIYDRDYYRDGSARDYTGLSATVGLIVLHVGLFFLLAFTSNKPGGNEIINLGGFQLEKVLRGEVWRIFTSQLIPISDLITIIIGMMMLYWAGKPLEEIYGSRVFLAFYLTAGLIAGLSKLVLGVTGLVPHPSEFGLAAPLFAVLILFACHYPRQIILLFWVLPVQVGHLVAVLIGLYLFSSLLSYSNTKTLLDAPSVLATAAFAGFFFLRGSRLFAAMRIPSLLGGEARSRDRRLRIYPSENETADAEPDLRNEPPARTVKPVDEHLEAKLDEVLEKLARFGPEQLTREENEVLMKASEAYQRLRK